VFALLFDMNQLWEGYIGALLRRAAGRRLDVATQEQNSALERAWSTEPGTVRPDFVVRTPDRTTVLLVADTKWRATPDGVPSDNELKQMFVYAELLNAPRAILLYPRTGPATERSGRFALSGRVCETKQLGVVDQHAWLGGAMQQQLETLLHALETKPNKAA
jgi:5-methylcytosine-specific restriction enzyme subunit McrC